MHQSCHLVELRYADDSSSLDFVDYPLCLNSLISAFRQEIFQVTLPKRNRSWRRSHLLKQAFLVTYTNCQSDRLWRCYLSLTRISRWSMCGDRFCFRTADFLVAGLRVRPLVLFLLRVIDNVFYDGFNVFRIHSSHSAWLHHSTPGCEDQRQHPKFFVASRKQFRVWELCSPIRVPFLTADCPFRGGVL